MVESYDEALRAIAAWRRGISAPVILETRRHPPCVAETVPLHCGDGWLVLLGDIEPETLAAVLQFMAGVPGRFDVVVVDPYLQKVLTNRHGAAPDLGGHATIRAGTHLEHLSPVARA